MIDDASERMKRGHETRKRRAEIIAYIRAHPGGSGDSIGRRFGISGQTAQAYRQELFGPRAPYTLKPDLVTRIRPRRKAQEKHGPPAFIAPDLPSSDEPLHDLRRRRAEEGARVMAAADARRLIPITVTTPGPIGIFVMGDPHIDDPGCDFERLERHVEAAGRRREYVFATNIGDLHNNWTGRLARLHGSQSTSHHEAWRLVEWLMTAIEWRLLIRGNHDCWSGSGDPLDWIMRGSGAVDVKHGARMELIHPCGARTRMHARHDFTGNSIYNDMHSLRREVLFGHRDHILVAGHRHIGGDAGVVNGDGLVSQLVRVSGYKLVDDYARQGGFHSKPIHASALIIVDPSRPETARDRAWCAPSIEAGMEYLDWMRAKYEGRARVVVRAR